MVLPVDDALYAFDHGVLLVCKGESIAVHRSIVFMKGDQRFDETAAAAGLADGDVVTTVFPLRANEGRNPDKGGVEEEDRIHDMLHHIEQVVTATDMRQFVEQDRFHLFSCEMREHANGYQDHRL